MFLYTLRGGIDQWRGLPRQWGHGWDSYAVRSTSFFGRSLVRENIAFGVRAIDHEDPRYFPLGQGSRWARVRYAIERTFLVKNDSGGTMPAYSLFVSAYTAPFIAQQWRPEHFTSSHPFKVGSARIGIAVGSDVFQEFWPDLKRKLKLDRRLHGLHVGG